MTTLGRMFPRMAKKRGKKALSFSKIVVITLLAFTALFTVAMTVIFLSCGAIPDTLVTAYFAFAGGEAGFLGLIKYADNKFSPKNPDDSDDGAAG